MVWARTGQGRGGLHGGTRAPRAEEPLADPIEHATVHLESNGVDHGLVGRALTLDLAVGQVGEDAHPGVADPLAGIGHLVLRAAEPVIPRLQEHSPSTPNAKTTARLSLTLAAA
jgi:hypothetical protein